MSRHWAEETAKSHLLSRGYELLAENYAVRGGELDLVMRHGDAVVFVEVRQRKTNAYGGAAESITLRKLQRLRKTALHYLVSTFGRDDLPVRFDAVLVTGSKTNFRLEHLENIG